MSPHAEASSSGPWRNEPPADLERDEIDRVLRRRRARDVGGCAQDAHATRIDLGEREAANRLGVDLAAKRTVSNALRTQLEMLRDGLPPEHEALPRPDHVGGDNGHCVRSRTNRLSPTIKPSGPREDTAFAEARKAR
jgi:hypothetical protein